MRENVEKRKRYPANLIEKGGGCKHDRREWATENNFVIKDNKWKNVKKPVADIKTESSLIINAQISIQITDCFQYLGHKISFSYREQRQKAVESIR